MKKKNRGESVFLEIVKLLKNKGCEFPRTHIEKKEGKYDIYLCGGHILHGAEGEFDDYIVQGQTHARKKPFTEGILLFVDECCDLDISAQTGSSELFCLYQDFMNELPDYFKAKQNQFVPFLKKEYGLLGGSTGKIRVLKGISIKESGGFCQQSGSVLSLRNC